MTAERMKNEVIDRISYIAYEEAIAYDAALNGNSEEERQWGEHELTRMGGAKYELLRLADMFGYGDEARENAKSGKELAIESIKESA